MTWNGTDEIIKDVLRKTYGKITLAAKELKINYATLKARIDNSKELSDFLLNVNREFDEDQVDEAELRLRSLVNQTKTKPATALRAIMYTLDNKGSSRGYGKNIQKYDSDKEIIKEQCEAVVNQIAEAQKQAQSASNIDKSKNNTQDKSY